MARPGSHPGTPGDDDPGLPDAAIHLDWMGARADGGSYRKGGLVRYLRSRAEPAFDELVLPRTGGRAGRGLGWMRAILKFLARTPSRAVLFFYPEFPLFHPPAAWKLATLPALLGAAKAVARARGLRLIVDVEDLPGPQRATFAGTSSGARVIDLGESLVDRFADEVWLPTESLARLWRSRRRVRIVPTCAVSTHTAARESRAAPRFLYAGSLDRRGVPEMISAFLEARRPGARLCLAGPGGGAIAPAEGLELPGELPGEECERYGAGCDYGLIPYPETGYFHDVFPAKLAFYAACGLEIATTSLRETKAAVSRAGIGQVVRPGEWRRFFEAAPVPARRVEAPWIWSQTLR